VGYPDPEIHTHSIQQKFPLDKALVDMKVESYIGCPCWTRSGQPIGLVVLMSPTAMSSWQVEIGLPLIKIIALRLSHLLELAITERAKNSSIQKLGNELQKLGHLNTELRHELCQCPPAPIPPTLTAPQFSEGRRKPAAMMKPFYTMRAVLPHLSLRISALDLQVK